jgi:hypothetical protein
VILIHLSKHFPWIQETKLVWISIHSGTDEHWFLDAHPCWLIRLLINIFKA